MLNPKSEDRPVAQVCLTIANRILRSEPVDAIDEVRNEMSPIQNTQAQRLSLPECPANEGLQGINGALTKEILQKWVIRDNRKTPPTAINLTKLCWTLRLSRDIMRHFIKDKPRYVIAGQKNIPRGTYVDIQCAVSYIKKHNPDQVRLLENLEQLDYPEPKQVNEATLSPSLAPTIPPEPINQLLPSHSLPRPNPTQLIEPSEPRSVEPNVLNEDTLSPNFAPPIPSELINPLLPPHRASSLSFPFPLPISDERDPVNPLWDFYTEGFEPFDLPAEDGHGN
ncbi:hypothetical protein FQN54_009336 [Arachnomyces sp. PD_36]|nr:hypothetical protein FQN54_009336 [Arachnomyces sp. PD_36]